MNNKALNQALKKIDSAIDELKKITSPTIEDQIVELENVKFNLDKQRR